MAKAAAPLRDFYDKNDPLTTAKSKQLSTAIGKTVDYMFKNCKNGWVERFHINQLPLIVSQIFKHHYHYDSGFKKLNWFSEWQLIVLLLKIRSGPHANECVDQMRYVYYVYPLVHGNASIKNYDELARSDLLGPKNVFDQMYNRLISSKDSMFVKDALRFSSCQSFRGVVE